MTGLDGINSLHKMLGALQTKETSGVSGAGESTAKAGPSVAQTLSAAGVDRASFSAASGLAAQSTDLSDVRTTKVAELRAAMASGTYNVSAGAVADKMIESMLS